MKLLIYIILFIVLLVYINNHSKKLTKEEFTNGLFDDFNPYQAVNPYDLIDKNVFEPTPIGDSHDFVVAYNENPSNTSELNNWILANSDYSDIFNGSDLGGDQISRTMGLPRPRRFLDKAMEKISLRKTSGETNENVNPRPVSENVNPRPVSENVNPRSVSERTLNRPVNERPIAEVHKQNTLQEIIPEAKTFREKSLYPLEIKNSGLKYQLLGYVYNTAYRQYYLIYEALNKQINPNLVLREKLDNMDTQTYSYALVKIEKSKPVIKYIFGPRTKININDVVYLSQGPLQIGPLIVDNI